MIDVRLRGLGWAEVDGVFVRPPSAITTHIHSQACTREICGVGPSREELVRSTLLRRLERNEEFLHYKRAEVLAMTSSPIPSSQSSPGGDWPVPSRPVRTPAAAANRVER